MPLVSLGPTGTGVLDGLRLAVKDVFDVAGHVTGCGNPDWRRTHLAAPRTASAISRLLAAGATLIGKTVTDELAYSLNGENAHYGTPVNSRAPGRIPGGSSSGSASAVASDLADVALGTDCGGSVRIPASFCGLYGIRPTHGRVASDGLVALAPSFDTIGWFASSADHLRRVGKVLLGDDPVPTAPRRLLIARDLLAHLDAPTLAALQPSLEKLRTRFEAVVEIDVCNGDATILMRAFRILQAAEIMVQHGQWIAQTVPSFGPGVRERFAAAAQVNAADVAQAQAVRDGLRRRLVHMLPPGTLLCLPSAPGIAPEIGASAASMEDFRSKAMQLLCIAGLAGLPQVSVPVAQVTGCPLGLSLMSSANTDSALLDWIVVNDLCDSMTLPDVNRPEVLAEMQAAFDRYEQALVGNQVAVLDHLFWDSEHTVRYGATENLVGATQIRAFRVARPSTGLTRTLQRTVITTFGLDTATACTEFSRAGSDRIGRQTQTWIRTDAGWKVVAAHVSMIDPP